MEVKDWLGKDNKIGIDIWENKYRHNNETFNEWLDRVSNGNESIKRLILEKKFLFGGRILTNRGTETKSTFSNCYVIPSPEDNLESIFDTAKEMARTYSYGGGVGIDLGKLAPRGAKVNNAAKESSGAVSFMDLYSLVTGLISQSKRRGALMLSMPVDHPDIEEFIDVKNNLDKVNFANISVRITDAFMKAVENNEDFETTFVRNATGEEITKTVNAKDLFRRIAENNWRTGEPGILFWDTIEGNNIVSEDDNIHYAGVNPCGEEPLIPYGACLLGSMNLSEYVVNPFSDNSYFDFDQFESDVGIATRELNRVLEEGAMSHPLKNQVLTCLKYRQIGLGIFGLADMLIKLSIAYSSARARKLCDKIANSMAVEAIVSSAVLASELGKFDGMNIEDTLKSPYLNRICDGELMSYIRENGLRNSQILTIAPTGTISTMLGVSGGIEPIYANSYIRTTKSLYNKDVEYKVYTPIVEQYMKKFDIENEKDLPAFFVTAKDIHWQERVDMQATWQKYIDASISSTVNLPNDATVEEIEEIYKYAWKSGLKGITVFRDGCERKGILSENTNDKKEEDIAEMNRGIIKKIGNDAIGLERHLTTGCGSLHCSAFFDRNTGELLETYLSKGSKGGCLSSLSGISRLISLAARGGISIENIIDQLNSSIQCSAYSVRKAVSKDTSKGNCCPAAVGNALIEMYNEMQDLIANDFTYTPKEEKEENDEVNKCPSCSEPLIFEGGCVVCKACGWSKCG